MEEILEKLNKLKGVLLLNTRGDVYLIRSYEVTKGKTVKESGWFGIGSKSKKVDYVDTITLSTGQIYEFIPSTASREVIRFINNTIDDRQRYLNLQKSLKNIGCIITSRRLKQC